MNLKYVNTKKGNFFVFEVDLETGLPVQDKPGFYATPEGAFLRKKNNACNELKWAKKKWKDQYKELKIPHEIHRPFAELFTGKPLQRSFGPKKEEVDPGPFAALSSVRDSLREAEFAARRSKVRQKTA